MFDVVVVIPVYNEGDCIGEVIEEWQNQLHALSISFQIMVLNDGSRDNTEQVITKYAGNENVHIVNKPNSGHGPTILQGYHRAVKHSDWVFQVDGDNEISAEHFGLLWNIRSDYDALIGDRQYRRQPLFRKIISSSSRSAIRLFFGKGVKDVNCPYRLMRSGVLSPLLHVIPDDTFAPNVAVSGLLVAGNKKVCNIPVPHICRRTGEVSLKRWKLLRAAIASFIQLLRIRLQVRHL